MTLGRALVDFDVVHGSALINLSDEDADTEVEGDDIAEIEESNDLAFLALVITDLDLEDTTDVLPENFDCARKSDVRDDFFSFDGLLETCSGSGSFSLLSEEVNTFLGPV